MSSSSFSKVQLRLVLVNGSKRKETCIKRSLWAACHPDERRFLIKQRYHHTVAEAIAKGLNFPDHISEYAVTEVPNTTGLEDFKQIKSLKVFILRCMQHTECFSKYL